MAILKIIKKVVIEETLVEFPNDTHFKEVKEKLEELKLVHETNNTKVEIKLIDGFVSEFREVFKNKLKTDNQ